MRQKTRRPVQFQITADSGVRGSVDQLCEKAPGGLLISQSPASVSSSFDASVRSDRVWVGPRDRTQSGGIWQPYAAPYESGIDLSEDEESQGRAAVARALEARKHSAVPRYRGRRRP